MPFDGAIVLDGSPILGIEGDRVDDRLVFTLGKPNVYKRTEPWQGIVIHWTGGEGKASQVERTLVNRRLGIHFVVDADGSITQLADLALQVAHAGTPGNRRYIGIEVVCRGFATKDEWLKASKFQSLRERTELDWQTPRDLYTDVVGGYRVRMAAFNPKQLTSVVWLVETLCGVFNIPRRIPHTRIVDVSKYKPPLPELTRQAMALPTGDGKTFYVPDVQRYPGKGRKSFAATFSGVLGHFHIHHQKLDPGTQVFYMLWTEGFNPLDKKLPHALVYD